MDAHPAGIVQDIHMKRRTFLQTAGSAGLGAELTPIPARGYIPEHNWEKHDWGSGPEVTDGLYQGPFPTYPPGPVVPGSEVVMVTTPSKDIVPNYGMGLTVYVSGDTGPPRLPGAPRSVSWSRAASGGGSRLRHSGQRQTRARCR